MVSTDHHFNRSRGSLRSDRVIEHDVHAAPVDLGNGITPDLKVAVVSIQQRCIQSRITIEAPRLIHQ